MKSKFLAITLILLLTGFSTAAECGCVSGDCGSPTTSFKQAAKPACHHEATEKNPAPRKGCCGKCQIEKTAILSTSNTSLLQVRPKHILTSEAIFTGTSEKRSPAPYLDGFLPDFVPVFFTEHVLGSALSFRAPPTESLQAGLI